MNTHSDTVRKIGIWLRIVGTVELFVAVCILFGSTLQTKALVCLLAVAITMTLAGYYLVRREKERKEYLAEQEKRKRNREETFETWLHHTKIGY